MTSNRVLTQNCIEMTIFGNPAAKQAAKAFYNPKAKKMIKFSPTKTKDWEQLIRSVAQDYRLEELLDCPLTVETVFYFLKPKSRSKKCIYPDRKPDHDNLEKAVFDALEGIIFTNDSRICEKRFRKFYGDPPRALKLLSDHWSKHG